MIEHDIDGSASGGAFPVLSPKKLIINNSPMGRQALFDTNASSAPVQVANVLGDGYIEYNYYQLTLRDNSKNVVWSINTQSAHACRIASPVYFKQVAGVDYIFFITTDYPTNNIARVTRIKLSDGTVTKGASLSGSYGDGNSKLFFTTADGLFCDSTLNYNIYQVDLENLTLAIAANLTDYPTNPAQAAAYITYDKQHAFRSIQVYGNFDNSQSWYGNLQFLGLSKIGGSVQRCYINLPNFVQDLPITESGYVTQISDSVVMRVCEYDGTKRLTTAIKAAAPCYFDKTDFDRWIAEIIEVLL